MAAVQHSRAAPPEVILSPTTRRSTVLRCFISVEKELDPIVFPSLLLGSFVLKVWICL
jgi:hypothetical protein